MRFEGGLSPYGLHADAILAWDPGEMQTLVEGCLNAGRVGGDVTDEVRPFSGADRRGTLPLPTVPDVAVPGDPHAPRTGVRGGMVRRSPVASKAAARVSSAVSS